MQCIEVAGIIVTFASIYGVCDNVTWTRDIMKHTINRMQNPPGIQVIETDWNATVEEVGLAEGCVERE